MSFERKSGKTQDQVQHRMARQLQLTRRVRTNIVDRERSKRHLLLVMTCAVGEPG